MWESYRSLVFTVLFGMSCCDFMIPLDGNDWKVEKLDGSKSLQMYFHYLKSTLKFQSQANSQDGSDEKERQRERESEIYGYRLQ